MGEEYSHYIHCRYGFLAPFDLHPPGIIDFGLAKLIYGLWNYDHRFLNILASLLLFCYRNNNSLKEDISKKEVRKDIDEFQMEIRSDSMLCRSSETQKHRNDNKLTAIIRGMTKGDNSEKTRELPKRNRVLNPKNDRMEN